MINKILFSVKTYIKNADIIHNMKYIIYDIRKNFNLKNVFKKSFISYYS